MVPRFRRVEGRVLVAEHAWYDDRPVATLKQLMMSEPSADVAYLRTAGQRVNLSISNSLDRGHGRRVYRFDIADQHPSTNGLFMQPSDHNEFPVVAMWRINAMRVLFLLMAVIMGYTVWSQLLFRSADWRWEMGLAKSMLAALALLSLLGVRYPLQMLPLMLYEMTWKSVWLIFIALRAYLNGKWTTDIQDLFFDCVGIVVAFFFVPWGYVWARYFAQRMEPLRRAR